MKNYQIEEIKKLINNNPSLAIEIYKDENASFYDCLHTDTSECVDFINDSDSSDCIKQVLSILKKKKIKSYGILNAEKYNKTLYANCGESQEDDTIIILVA